MCSSDLKVPREAPIYIVRVRLWGDCGEIITESDIERGEGLIKCNKAGCETRWVSPWFYLWRNGGYLLQDSFT